MLLLHICVNYGAKSPYKGDLTIKAFTKSEIGTSWHHYAITSDGDKIYVFIDGIKKAEETLTAADKTYLAGIKHYTYSTQGGGYVLWGRLSQIAICDECKWTSNFTVPTVAYRNAI